MKIEFLLNCYREKKERIKNTIIMLPPTTIEKIHLLQRHEQFMKNGRREKNYFPHVANKNLVEANKVIKSEKFYI